ncbi:MAG: hypothetical protein ACLUOF_07405 [Ruminococcus sp.]
MGGYHDEIHFNQGHHTEERIRIVTQSLQVCGQTCEFCNGCDNLGGGMVDSYFQPYINGEKEIAELNAAYHSGLVR